jgi:HK97 family phage portal protein
MGIIDRGLKAVSINFIPADAAQSILPYPGNSITGYPDDSELNIMAVLACVRVLSETVAQLPLKVYRNLPGGGKEPALDHPLYRVLHHRANPQMTSFVWRETSMAHLVTWGNCYSEIVPNALGEPAALYPLRPDRMHVKKEGNQLVYEYQRPDQPRQRIPTDRIFHIPGLAFDGLIGYSPVTLMRNPLGIIRSAERYGRRMLDNDARPSTVVKYPGKLSKEARANLKNTMEAWRGSKNAGKSAILEEGLDIKDIGFPPQDAQYLETRAFQIEEIARGFRMQLHMIQDLRRSTFSNIEHQSLEFVKYTMLPWLTRWEQALVTRLVDPADEGVYFAEFLVDGIERGDALSRAASLNIQRLAGVLTGDEWRAMENRNPLPDGQGTGIWRPLNITGDDIKPKIDAAAILVDHGYDPRAALVAVGLDPIAHLGLLPTTLAPPELPEGNGNGSGSMRAPILGSLARS